MACAMSSLTSRPLPSTSTREEAVTTPKSKDREWLVYRPSTGWLRSHDHPDLFHRPWRPGQARCDPWPNFQHDEQSYGSGIGIGLAYTASLRRQPPCAVLTRDGPALPRSRLSTRWPCARSVRRLRHGSLSWVETGI